VEFCEFDQVQEWAADVGFVVGEGEMDGRFIISHIFIEV